MIDENGGGPAFLKEGPDLSGRTNVRRPPAPHVNPKDDEFTFMQIDTDYYTSAPPGNSTYFCSEMYSVYKECFWLRDVHYSYVRYNTRLEFSGSPCAQLHPILLRQGKYLVSQRCSLWNR
jgi:hypothetical protein